MTARRSSLALLFTLLAAALLIAGCGGSDDGDGGDGGSKRSGSSESDGGKTSGCDSAVEQTTVDGVDALRHCGPARVSVSVDGRTIAAKGGECQKTDEYLTINVGTQLTGTDGSPNEDAPTYVGINVGKTPASSGDAEVASKDGSYTKGSMGTVVSGANTYVLTKDFTVTLKDDRSAGDFQGKTLDGGVTVTGSFSC